MKVNVKGGDEEGCGRLVLIKLAIGVCVDLKITHSTSTNKYLASISRHKPFMLCFIEM